MRTLYLICLGAMLALIISAAPVQAAVPIVYVSAGGNDSNLCTFAAPCRNFQRAVSMVQVGGTVQALNAASYGNVTINKSLTISGGGNIVALGHRITINSASAVVVLRDLVMDGRGTGVTGILISAAAAVHIEDVEVERYTGNGIWANGSNTELFIADTVSRHNGFDGLRVDGDGTTATLAVDNSRFENNRGGLIIVGIASSITRSVASGNAGHGILVFGGTANIAWTTAANNGSVGFYVSSSVSSAGQMTLESSVARGNGYGIQADTGATARISNSVVTDNPIGINNFGTVLTRRNNTVSGNTDDLGGDALTPLAGT